MACFLFLWGFGGYHLLKWLNKGESPAPEGKAIGDKLNSLTGGRLDFLMGPARETEAKNEKNKNPATTADKPEKSGPKKLTNGQANGAASGADLGKHADTVKRNANLDAVTDKTGVNGAAKQANLDGVTKQANADGVKNKVGTTTGTLKGTVGGATGLA